jgi:addiction module HigA family antidote
MTATRNRYPYTPDYAFPPGETLAEVLADRGMSQAELARRAGLSAKHVNQVVLGAASITAETALRLERVTGVPAQVWTNLKADYQVTRTLQDEESRLNAHIGWLRSLPVNELARRGYVRPDTSGVDRLRDVLAFCKVATPEAWHQVWALPTAYRRSQAFEADYGALATWLRIGELRAEELNLQPFNRARFRAALGAIRDLTIVTDPKVWLPQTTRLCAEAG